MIMLVGCNDSVEPLQQAHDLYEQSKQYKKEKDVERQVTTLMQAYDLLPQINDPALASQICQALGSAYMYRDLYDESLHYNREAINYALQEEPHSKQLSLAFSQLGRTFVEMNVPDSAQVYFDKALNLALQLKDTTEIAVGYGQLGVVSRLKDDYYNSLAYKQKQLAIYKQHNDSNYIPQAYYGIGSTYYSMGQLDSAKVCFEEALNTNNVYTIHGAYKALYLISKKQGKLEDAIRYNDKFRDYADSVNYYNRTEAVAEIQAKYDNERLQNQQKTLELQQSRTLLLMAFILVAALIIITAIIFKLHRKDVELQKAFGKLLEDEQIIFNSQKKLTEAQQTIKEMPDQITARNAALEMQNVYMQDFFNSHYPILKDIGNPPYHMPKPQLLFEAVDAMQLRFYSRLKAAYPDLSERELIICCLVRLGYKTGVIAHVIHVESNTMTKLKNDIKRKLLSKETVRFADKSKLDSMLKGF
jgi:tetratricopeptide (TPR) repeat protein